MDKLSRSTKVQIALVSVAVAVLIGLPIYTQTGNYPIAIVQGNSMYPTLHNGDMVIFHKAPSGVIANGTIIVVVQGDTGVTALDSLIRPVIIHRIVGTVIQGNGEVYYRTKGDNNQYIDPQLAQANHVLGVPLVVIPDGGIMVLFFESPEGLVALIGMITLYYLGKYEVKMKDDETKSAFLGELTRLVLEKEISRDLFDKLEPIVKYGKGIGPDTVHEYPVHSLLDWIKKDGLVRRWKVENIACPVCSSRATSFVTSKSVSFVLCQNCASLAELPEPEAAEVPQGRLGPEAEQLARSKL